MATQFNNLYLASGGTLALAFGTSATKVYGSVDADTVTIAAGVTVVLDGSFNRGNDTIKFSGNAASYTIVRVNASTVRVTDADGTSVTIPVGSAGTKIEFADATRTLSGSSAGIMLGNQAVTATPLELAAGTAPAPVENYVLSVSAASVTEGDLGSKTLSYRLTLDKAPTSTVTLNYETLDTGTATANDDFTPAAGTVTFAAGQRTAFVSVDVLGDTTVEAPETVKLSISGSKLVSSVEATGTIVDNDLANLPITYTLTGTNAVNEGSAATFTLKTTGLSAGTTVGYKVTGTGSAAAQSATGTFTVDSDGNATVSVPVSSNNTVADTGLLTIELLNGKAPAVTATVIDGTPTTYSAAAITAANASSGVLAINVSGTAAQAITLDTDQLTPSNGFVINSATAPVSVTSSGLNDKITLTGSGNNTINTGNGNDTVLLSGSGNNTVVVGAGNDTVTITGSGSNRVEVGSGNDTVTGGAGAETIVMGSGALTAADVIDGGDGIDTLIVSGDGNEINANNVKNIENLVLNGTQVAFSSDAVLESFGSVQGSSATSEITVTVASSAVVDLSKVDLVGIKSIKLDAAAAVTGVTVIASSTDLAAVGAFTRGTNVGAVNLETDVAGYKLFSAANDTAFTGGTKTVTGTAQELIANKSDLTGATLKVSGSTSLADISALADAGVTAIKTVTLSVSELLTAATLPDQLAALTAANTLIQVTGTATVAQAAALNTSYGTQIAAYQSAATGNAGIAISDTPSNVAAQLNGNPLNATGANAATVSSITLTSGSGVAVADGAKLALLASTKLSGSYTVTDSVANITTAITGSSLPASLSKAASVTLSTGNRTATTTADALELQILGSKLVGGYDYTRTDITTLNSDDLTAISGAAKASLAKTSGSFSVTEVNSILAQNSSATVNKIADTAQNLSLNASKLKAATSDIFVNTIATVEQANAFGASVAALAAKQGATIDPQTGQNSYKISDTKAAVLATSAATTVKASDGVTVSDAMSLAEATQLQALTAASPTNGRLNSGELVYTVSDSASALATALSATVNTATVAALAGASANGVTATGTATVAEAKVLGAQYSSAVQVDSYNISDTVAKLFTTPTGSTLSTDIDATSDAALAKATTLSVVGNVTVAQLAALKGVQNNANANIFDNKYAITDTAGALSAAAGNALADLRAATSITVSNAATVAQLAGLKTLNDSRTTDATSLASFTLKDTISNVVGTSALGSGTAAVVAFAKTASSITVTGNATSSDADQITLDVLDNLATKAGGKAYTVEVTDTANNVEALSAGVLGSAVITKLVLNDSTLSVANAKDTIAKVGAAASKLSYNLVDSVDNLLATADASVVTSAVNLTANDAAISAANAAKLVALTGTSGTVTYSLNGTYADLVAQSASIADGATAINVSNTSLTVTQYTELLARAGQTTTVTTTVSAEVISGTAAEVSGASAAVLAHASSVTLTDNASLTLTAAQAKALVASGNAGYDVTVTPASSTLQVKIVDTTANLIKAKSDSATDNALAYVLGAGSYKVVASDTATLSVANADILRSISDIEATYNLADASGNLVSSGTAVAAVAGASSITVTATAQDATEAAEAKAIYDANKNVSFDVVTSTADILKAQTNNVYDYAATLTKAAKVVLTGADVVADVKAAVAAAGGKPVEYNVTDTPTNLAATGAQSVVAGAKVLAFSSGTPTALEAVALAPLASKFSGGKFNVTDTAANLVTNLSAVDAAGGTVTLLSGAATVAQFNTLKAALGADLATTAITDSASAVANLLIAQTAGTGTKTLTSDVSVNATQASALATASIATTALKITDTADALLALGDSFVAASFTVSGGSVDISTAKNLVDIHEGKAVFSVATTAERFTKAYDSDVVTSGAQADAVAKDALAQATSLTVDGVSVTLGSKNAALIVGGQSTYNNKIVGSVAEINALSASLKSAAGFVIVDTVANITNPANTALIAASAGYVVKDSAASLALASASVLNSTQKALGVEVTGTATVEQITTIKANSDVDAYIVYSLSDSAANLAPSGTANSNLSGAVGVTVTGDPTTAAVANAILTANSKAVVSARDSATSNLLDTNVITAGNLAKLASITADASSVTAGIQGISVANAASLISGKGANATLTFNINDDANLVAGAAATTLAAAGTISIKDTSVASAADAKILAGLTLATPYTVTDTAGNLTTSATVSLLDLAKAGTVKILSGTATVAQAAALTGLANFEKGTTGADLGKYVVSISDTALNLAKSGAADLLNGLTAASTVAVSNYTAVLTAAEAKALADLDAASTKLTTTAASVKVEDSSAALLAPGVATTLAAVGSISVTDVVSVSTLNQIRAVGGTANSEVYTYKLQDTAGALIAAGSATVDGATSVAVSGSVSVADMTIIEGRATAGGVATTTSYATVTGTATQLFGGSGSTLNTTVGSKAVIIDLNGSASVDQVTALLADSNFDKSYSVADTADNIIAAINQDSSLTVLKNAGSVGLSTGGFASVAQASMINANLTNEAALAIKDSAANLNASANAATVAVAGSVTVNADTGNDGVTAGITAAKVTYDYASLSEIDAATVNGTKPVEVINGKAGDVIDLSGILDWDTVTSGNQALVKDTDGTLVAGEYQTQRGYYQADGTFQESSSGTDTLLLIYTDATAGADEQIVILGVTSLTVDLVTDVNTFTFG
jgi:hypothetical protein